MDPTKTPAMLEIESRFGGRDIRALVSDAYARHGNLRAVAKELGTSHSLVWDVVARFDGQYERGLIFPGLEAVA